jgi:hypothetical protein
VAERGLVVSKPDDLGVSELEVRNQLIRAVVAGRFAFYHHRSMFGPFCVCVSVGLLPASLNHACRRPPPGDIGFTRSSTTAIGSWLAGTLPALARCVPLPTETRS